MEIALPLWRHMLFLAMTNKLTSNHVIKKTDIKGNMFAVREDAYSIKILGLF
jgi:hypothetical protein